MYSWRNVSSRYKIQKRFPHQHVSMETDSETQLSKAFSSSFLDDVTPQRQQIFKSNQIKSLLLSHHHSTCALMSEILESVLQTVQKQLTYRQYHYCPLTTVRLIQMTMCNIHIHILSTHSVLLDILTVINTHYTPYVHILHYVHIYTYTVICKGAVDCT